jgi:hypothetical protein
VIKPTHYILLPGYDGGDEQLIVKKSRLREMRCGGEFHLEAPYAGDRPYPLPEEAVHTIAKKLPAAGTAQLRIVGLSMGGQLGFLLLLWLFRAGWRPKDIIFVAEDPPFGSRHIAGFLNSCGVWILGHLPKFIRRRSKLAAQCGVLARARKHYKKLSEGELQSFNIVSCKGNMRVIKSDKALAKWRRYLGLEETHIHYIEADHDLLSADTPADKPEEWQKRHAAAQAVLADTLAAILKKLHERFNDRYGRLHSGVARLTSALRIKKLSGQLLNYIL